MTEKNAQQTETSDQPKLTPDFRHRLCGDVASSANLEDSVLTLTDQAENLLVMIKNQFIDEDDEDRSRLADRVIFHSLDAVSGLIKDIGAIVNAYYEADRETRKSQ